MDAVEAVVSPVLENRHEGTFQAVTQIHPDAFVYLDQDTFFVAIQQSQGRLVLGWGPTVKKAMDAAAARNEGQGGC